MGGGPIPVTWHEDDVDDRSSEDAVEVSLQSNRIKDPLSNQMDANHDMTSTMGERGASVMANDGMAAPQNEQRDEMATLLYSKSKVYLHPSDYLRDNIPGFISIVKVGHDYLLAWIPEASVIGTSDFDAYVYVELDESASTTTTMVTAPLIMSDHAFSIPIRTLYSVLVQPPTLTSWYGSINCSLFGGATLAPLYFHDEESQSTVLDRDRRVAALGAMGSASSPSIRNEHASVAPIPPSWGGEAVLSQLRKYAHLLRSQIEPQLFLVNPSREDIEVHSTALFEDDAVPNEALQGLRLRNNESINHQQDQQLRQSRERKRNSILHQSLNQFGSEGREFPDDVPTMDNFTFSVLNQFSKLTRGARSGLQNAAQSVLSHPLAKPLAKHVPEPIAHFANAPGELTRLQETAGVGAYDAARVYLAKWARVVAEEGERARRAEVIVKGSEGRTEDTEIGAFEVLSSVYKISKPKSSRAPATPIVVTEWAAWFDDKGQLMLDEFEARKRIFQRGLEHDVRRDVWPFLLKVFPWDSTTEERKELKRKMTEEYERLKAKWFNNVELKKTDRWAEEDHRIEIDCRRTDRTHPMFMADNLDPSEQIVDSPHPPSNEHVRSMQQILLCYVFAEDTRDYVQGMSDLLSPIYVVCDGDPVLALGCFETIMERMKNNFLRDQSGMKSQLSKLQSLIRTMDEILYKHFDQTGSLNLFFCFRWILCGFKREFSFDQTLRLWEVLFTDWLGSQFHLFIALSIIEAHRDIIIRYLREFDEILKYVNELSGSLDVEAIISDAEVLYATFQQVVDARDRRLAEERGAFNDQHPSADGLKRRLQSSDARISDANEWQSSQRVQVEEPLPTAEEQSELRALLK